MNHAKLARKTRDAGGRQRRIASRTVLSFPAIAPLSTRIFRSRAHQCARSKERRRGRRGRERATRSRDTVIRFFVYPPRINYSSPLSEPNPTRDCSRERERVGRRRNADASAREHPRRDKLANRRRERAHVDEIRRWWKSEKENEGGNTRDGRYTLMF